MLQQETVKGSRDNLGNGKKFRYSLLRLSNYHYAIRRLKMLNFKKLLRQTMISFPFKDPILVLIMNSNQNEICIGLSSMKSL